MVVVELLYYSPEDCQVVCELREVSICALPAIANKFDAMVILIRDDLISV